MRQLIDTLYNFAPLNELEAVVGAEICLPN